MMRIVIAGTGGLAKIIAYYLNDTSHMFFLLSRQPQPDLTALGYQVVVVNYEDESDLRFNLQGVDLVISTISGTPQINLIDAAANSRVRHFIPAEFEGPPGRRPTNDPLDRGRAACLDRLRHWSHQRRPMRSTIFSCGVFYERFARGGLAGMNIGFSTGVAYPGSYLMNIESNTAEIVERTHSGQPIYISMISVADVGRFLVAALELGVANWPGEFRMQGERMTVSNVLQCAEAIKGGMFSTDVIEPQDLTAHLEQATYYQDWPKVDRIQELIATEQRRYDFSQPNLNALVNVTPTPFWDWLSAHWGAQ